VRLGICSVLGPSHVLKEGFERAVEGGAPPTLPDQARRSRWPASVLRRLAGAGALRCYARSREEALRQVDLLRFHTGEELPLFAGEADR
jgi:hypothetical protein